MLAKRRTLEAEFVEESSQRITEQIQNCAAYQQSRVIALYAGFVGEVQAQLLYQAVAGSGRLGLFPRLQGRGPHMDFCPVTSLDQMVVHPMGMPEPPPESEVVALDQIDLVLVPGVAFDQTGARLGFGGGSYDRVLNRLKPGSVRMGVCYRFQVVESVPCSEHDVMMDQLVTEQGLLPLGRRPGG